MSPQRKAARDKLLGMKTRSDLDDCLQSLNLTAEEREIAVMVFADGLSLTQVQMAKDLSRRQLQRRLAKVYDKLI